MGDGCMETKDRNECKIAEVMSVYDERREGV